MSFVPVVALVGAPNVGKSTFFNYVTHTRSALVVNAPGSTRDRQYKQIVIHKIPFLLVDTGGFYTRVDPQSLEADIEMQTGIAVREADIIVWILDGSHMLSALEQRIAQRLKSFSPKVVLLLNKIEGKSVEDVPRFELGYGAPHPVSARSGWGVASALEHIAQHYLTHIQRGVTYDTEHTQSIAPQKLACHQSLINRTSVSEHEVCNQNPESHENGIRLAILGRPNVGKSTLINHLVMEERVLVANQSGTTRSCIEIPHSYKGKQYILLDTAGLMKKPERHSIEYYSTILTVKAMHSAHVVVLMLNAREGILDQDVRLLDLIIQSGKPVIVAANQMDSLSDLEKKYFLEEVNYRFAFAPFVQKCFISALFEEGLKCLYHMIDISYRSSQIETTTHKLTEILEKAIFQHQPPCVKGRRIRLRYAHLGGQNPWCIVVHGKQTSSIPVSYQRYLTHFFQKTLGLIGVPLSVQFKNDRNPYLE